MMQRWSVKEQVSDFVSYRKSSPLGLQTLRDNNSRALFVRLYKTGDLELWCFKSYVRKLGGFFVRDFKLISYQNVETEWKQITDFKRLPEEFEVILK
ncbi:MAG TPA: hypothetical protein VFI24_11710 [Pyrinomonadaceae bacterium]|nr:hypothetical protein [Pyrinomonadaceae bacterium]